MAESACGINVDTLHRKCYDVAFNLKGSNYASVRNIGSGAYGVVCAALHQPTGQQVAIKKLHNVFENTVLARRTYREMKILRHFNHDNIIRIREVLQPSRDEIYLVFDLMETDLHQVICSPQPLTDEHIRYFLFQILSGLNYIHSAKVIHRDLKPSNLLVNENCDLKIGDFGMARAVQFADSDYQSTPLLMTWYVMTRWYRAPELLLFRRQYTVAVDIWSVGCIFAELIGRRALFPGKDLLGQLTLIKDTLGTPAEDFVGLAHSDRIKGFLHEMELASAVPWKTSFPSAPAKALTLLEKMLRWHPDERISAGDALRDLYLNKYYDPTDVQLCNLPLTLSFDEEQVSDMSKFRELICTEMTSYNSTCVTGFVTSRLPRTTSHGDSSAGSTTITDNSALHAACGTCAVTVADQTTVMTAADRKLAIPVMSGTKAKALMSRAKRSYQKILPAMCRQPADTQPPALSTKQLLRAAILAGRHKQPVLKQKRRRNIVQQPVLQQAIQPRCLSEQDKILLERWKQMQQQMQQQQQQPTLVATDCRQQCATVPSSSSDNTATDRLTSCIVTRLTTDVQSVSPSLAVSSADNRLIDVCLSEMVWTPPVAVAVIDCSLLNVRDSSKTDTGEQADNDNHQQCHMSQHCHCEPDATSPITCFSPVSNSSIGGYGVGINSDLVEMSLFSAELSTLVTLDDIIFGK